jgi:putative ABC transport system permease protein
MSFWSRLVNVARPGKLRREIDEELVSHVEEAIASGRDPAEAQRAFGSHLRQLEASRDVRLATWLDSLRADAVFGWRQLRRNKIASVAAILSLALAIGACTSAFRLIDALLLRPMPVSDAERLHVVAFTGGGLEGYPQEWDSCSYPMFERMRDAVSRNADLVAVSYMDFADITYGSEQEIEKAHVQAVSARMFPLFGLEPALGRLLTADDDSKSGAHPYAVLSYDYWTRRFARNPEILGHKLQRGDTVFVIAGVAPPEFTGTETGTVTDVFVPISTSNPELLASPNNFWLRTFVKLKPGVQPEPVYDRLRAVFQQIQIERARSFVDITKSQLQRHFAQRLLLLPAAAGRSNLQRDYRRSLSTLGILVALVLLIACANVSNLMTARAASRAKEMALRVSIGAGRRRLVQLLALECAWITLFASALGALFAWWSAPFIVARISPADDPAQLMLTADWRILVFGFATAGAVTLLFGLAPALRASGVKPAGALKGGEDPRQRGRLMHALIALQVAFCFVVLFVAGLFIASFDKLSNQPVGFSPERILNLETVTARPQPAVFWNQLADRLRAVPGVEKVALTGWPMMSGESNNDNVSINGAPPSEVLSDFVFISPGWAEAMKIPFLAGRDFRPSESNPGVAIVNLAFAKQYLNGENPVGRWFERVDSKSKRIRIQIVGLIPDARSRSNLRIPIRPTAYVPFQSQDPSGALRPKSRGTYVVRTAAANPLALAPSLRKLVAEWRPGFRVNNVRTQLEICRSGAIRERLLALLALFFAIVALLLAGVGLYGVLDYSVLQRRREIGIRLAIGASRGDIARNVTLKITAVVALGGIAGILLGLACARYIESLLYQIRITGPLQLAVPAVGIFLVGLAAALRPVLRAIRIDPAGMLRIE